MTNGTTNRRGNGMMISRAKRIRWSRLVAGLLCLCMVLSVFIEPARQVDAAGDTGSVMTVYLYLWHTDDKEGTLAEGYPIQITKSSEADTPVTAPAEYGGEKFTAFSVSVGYNAITKLDDDTSEIPTAYVKYSPLIQTVKIVAYYSTNQDASGLQFGGSSAIKGLIEVESPEVDVVRGVSKNAYNQVLGKETEATDKDIDVYNTSVGLHTDKTAKVSDLAAQLDDTGAGNSPRTFDVTLESWFAGNNLADVGLVLDASGSMAWPVDELNDINRDGDNSDQQVVRIDEEEYRELFNEEDGKWDSINHTRWLTQEEVDSILELDKSKTDNSLLGYGGYKYYVFDGRPDTNEYVMLGYWDGKGSLGDGLIGYYPFDDTLENKADEGETAWFIGPATGDETTGKIFSDVELEESLKPSNSNVYTSGGEKGSQCLIVYDGQSSTKKGIIKTGNVLLDTTLSGKNFTISFAVKSGNEEVKDNLLQRPLSDIMYIGPTGDTFKTEDHYRIYRDGYSSANRVKVDTNIENHSDKTIVSDSKLSINTVFSNKDTWKVLTFVCKGGEISVYTDGVKYEEPGNDTTELLKSFTEKAQHIIIGGTDPYGPDSLYLDELYVYDRALSDSEVAELSTLTKSGSTSPVAAKIEENGKVRNLASVNNGNKIGTAKMAGWYYVNSTSNIRRDDKNDIETLDTAKVFNALIKGTTKDYYEADKFIYKTDVLPPEGTKEESGKRSGYEIETGPNRFFIDQNGYLYCVFNPNSNYLAYSNVYYKKSEQKIKTESLQEALGVFVNKLALSSPESRVAAVRFSTKNYYKEKSNKTVDYDLYDKLVMLNWTTMPGDSTVILNQDRGSGKALGGTEVNGKTVYNYLLTGGTYLYTGLKTFQDKLLQNNLPDVDKGEDQGAKKYLIVFTDGKDNTVTGTSTDDQNLKTQTIKLAEGLKEAGWAIYGVMLTGGAFDSKDITDNTTSIGEFWEDIVGVKESDMEGKSYTDYIRIADGSNLAAAFQGICEEISCSLSDYTVQDYIDPRFDLIVRTEGDASSPERWITLNAGGEIEVKDLPTSGIDTSTSTSTVSEERSSDAKTLTKTAGEKIYAEARNGKLIESMLYYDSAKDMYFVKFTGQTIPGCLESSTSLDVWRATFTLRAKEDFIGGNAVLTNGQSAGMNYVYSEDEEGRPRTGSSSGTSDMYQTGQEGHSDADMFPSKGFPRVTVNVGTLPKSVKDTRTIYLGEKISPLSIATALVKELKNPDPEMARSHYYWEYLERYAWKSAVIKNKDAAADDADKNLLEFLTELIKQAEEEGEKSIDIPYAYLSEVPSDGNPSATQTGGDTHEGDILSVLSYSWAPVNDGTAINYAAGEETETGSADGTYATKASNQRGYKISVQYAPLQEGDKTNPANVPAGERKFGTTNKKENLANRVEANNGNGSGYAGLIDDDFYKWRNQKDSSIIGQGEKPPVGDEQKTFAPDKLGQGIETINIVRGELALEVVAEKGYLEQWFANHPDKSTLDVTVNVKRSYEPSIPDINAAKIMSTAAPDGAQNIARTGNDGADGVTSNETVQSESRASETSQGGTEQSAADLDGSGDPTLTGPSDGDPVEPAAEILSLHETTPINASTEDDWNKDVVVHISKTDLEDAVADENGKLHFYSYYNEAAEAALPQERPIGKYILTPSDTNDDALQKFSYADRDKYEGHFSKKNEGGVIGAEENENNYYAPQLNEDPSEEPGKLAESTGTDERIGFYLGRGSEETSVAEGESTTGISKLASDPDALEPYLNYRLGMVRLETATGSLTVEKEVRGDAAETDREFTFTVKLLEEDGKTVNEAFSGWYGKEIKDGDEAASTGDGMKFEEGIATFTLKAGESRTATFLPAGLKYTVEETVTDTENDGYKTSVEITDTPLPSVASSSAPVLSEPKSGRTTDVSTIKADTETTLKYTNERTPATAELTVNKRMELTSGSALRKDYTFTFTITPDESNPAGGAQKRDASGSGTSDTWNTWESGSIEQSVTVSAGSSMTTSTGNFFEDVRFVKEGTYKYALKENAPTSNPADGVTYDTNEYEVTVTVAGSTETPGNLIATIEVTETGAAGAEASGNVTASGSTATVTFVNTLDDPEPVGSVGVALKLEKTLTAETETPLPEQTYEFTFEIHAADTNPDADPLGNKNVTVSVGPSDWTQDKSVYVTYTEAGTYHYEVKERSGSGLAGIIYDENVHELTVTVEETGNAEGTRALSAEVELDGATADSPVTVRFKNTYRKDQVNVILHGKKTLENGTLQDGRFTFTLTPVSAEVERTGSADPSAAAINEEAGDPAQQDGQTSEADAEEQDGQTSEADAEEQDGQASETDAEEQDGQTAETDAVQQDSQTTETDAVQQDGQMTETDAAQQDDQTTQPNAAEQDSQTPQTEVAQQDGQTVSMDSTQQQGAQTDVSMMGYRATASGGHSFLGSAPVSGGYSFPGSFPGAAPMGGRRAVHSAPAMLAEEIITEPVAGSGDIPENEIIPEDEFWDIPEDDSWDGAESGQESDAESTGESGTEDLQDANLAVELTGEPIEVVSVPDGEEILGTATETVALSPGDVPMPADAKEGIATAKNGGSGAFNFGSITYTEPGTYRYEIREQKGEDTDKIKYDETVYDVTVTVVRNEKTGALVVQNVEYKVRTEGGSGETKRDLAEFTNRVYTGSLTVTKVNRSSDIDETIVLADAQFYVALFEDSALEKRIGDVKTIRFSGSSASTSVTFDDLEVGTYYVSETDADGKPANGGEYGGGVYSAQYPDGREVEVRDGSKAEFSFENVFSTLPDPRYYKNVKDLIITKKVVNGNGTELNTDEVFYAGIFADAGYTQLANHVSRNIVALEMGGNSSASATVQVTVPSEGELRLYVTEVDANGAPVANSGSFEYRVSVAGGLLSLNIDSTSPTVTITNTVTETPESETEPETETDNESEIIEESESGDGASGSDGVSPDASAAKTGDETPVGRLILLMVLSAATLLIVRSRRGKGRTTNP